MAKKIVAKNGFGEKISVIGKCSTDLDLERGKSVEGCIDNLATM